jgi:divalent anion:Na+ symporter, DASS family
MKRERSTRRLGKLLSVAVVVGIGLTIWFLPAFGGLGPAATHLTAIFIATILGLILRPLPQGAVVMAGIALAGISNTLPIADVLAGFADATVWLIVLAFLLTRGFIKTGLGRRISLIMVRIFGGRTLGLAYALTLSDLIIAPATPSNTARAGGILFPIVRSLCSNLGSEPGPTARRVGTFLMFNQFQVNLVTSALFLTAVAPNSLMVKLARETFRYDITWIGWFWAAMVPGIASLAILPLLIYRLLTPEIRKSSDAPRLAREELEKMGPMRPPEAVMLAVFCGTLALWATGQWTNLGPTPVALVGVCGLIILGVLDWQDILSETGAWDALAWFGGLVSLSAGLSKLGVIDLLAARMQGALGGMQPWILGFLLVVVAYMYSHYFIASMTAHATALYVPLCLVAMNLGAPVSLVTLVLGFANSLNAAMTTYGTGSSPIYFGAGYIDQATWWKNGLIVSLVNLAIWLGIGGFWWKIIGLW